MRRFTSPNVIGIVPGSLADAGAVVVTAHYDAYGIGPPDASGDRIYNGAIDNAMGVAALIELARHFAADEHQTERTLVFVATTAEERGTLGARYYADHPVVELDETTVVINLDGVNALAPTDDFIVFPSVGTETGAALALIGERADMRLTSEPWQVGMHFAFDTAPFLRRGLVGLTLWQGSAYRGVSKEELEDHLRRVRAMHTPADEWHDPANLGAVEQHLALYVAAVEHFADASTPRPVLSRHHPFGDAAPP